VRALVLGVAGGMIAILLATTFDRSSIYLIRDFLPEFRSLIEPASEGGDEIIVPCPGLRPCSLGGRLRKRRCRREPEADKQGERLDGNTDVALEPRQASILLVKPLCDRGLAALGGIGRAVQSSARASFACANTGGGTMRS
jgi:hypothetical protein